MTDCELYEGIAFILRMGEYLNSDAAVLRNTGPGESEDGWF